MNDYIKPIPGYEGRYSARRDGAIISHSKLRGRGIVPECELRGWSDCGGYRRVELSDGPYQQRAHLAHRLVCLTFLGQPPSPTHQVNHKNGIKHDNRIENLEWVTGAENMRHAYLMGLNEGKKGSKNANARLDEDQVKIIRGLCAIGVMQKTIAKLYSVAPTLISLIYLRKAWKHVA